MNDARTLQHRDPMKTELDEERIEEFFFKSGWKELHRNGMAYAGLIPTFFSAHDPRTLQEQLNEYYAHGGGWMPLSMNWEIDWESESSPLLLYHEPGSRSPEVFRPVVTYRLRNQFFILFSHAFAAIIEADGTFAVGRID